jgi:hypothetical protein
VVDQLIGELVARARKQGGVATRCCAAALRRWLSLEPPSRWLVIEPDAELRRIVMHEMTAGALRCPSSGCTPEDCAAPGDAAGLDARGAAQQGGGGAQAAARVTSS